MTHASDPTPPGPQGPRGVHGPQGPRGVHEKAGGSAPARTRAADDPVSPPTGRPAGALPVSRPSTPPPPGSPDRRPRGGPDPATAPGPLADASPRERLARWDELPPWDLRALEADPELGPALAHLRTCERELTGAPDWARRGECPPAEVLFDHGGGPGAERLEPALRAAVTDHLAECEECAGLVAGLRRTPPPPLILEHEEPRHPVRQLARWVPAAAAAAVLVVSVAQLGSGPVASEWPVQPLLRGEGEPTLLFPRGPVLAPDDGGRWATAPRFELAPVEGADRYRVVLRRHDGGAFDAGTAALELSADAPTLVAASPLEPGHYTWEAFARRDGLERPLGERDFEVRVDPELARAAAPRAGVARVRLLHVAGYLTDARALARELPASEARDAYLSPPGSSPGPEAGR